MMCCSLRTDMTNYLHGVAFGDMVHCVCLQTGKTLLCFHGCLEQWLLQGSRCVPHLQKHPRQAYC